MNNSTPIIEVNNLVYNYGRRDAVNGMNLKVRPGTCHGLFGRNGAGKTTTLKCLLNLLRPRSGSVRLFNMDPANNEVAVKSRLAFVPDALNYFPWMTVRDTLNYFASFRSHWNRDLENDLMKQFRLDPGQNVNGLSKGQKTLLALMSAVCPEPELLILDEPTSGLDPIVRREFIETVIGAYQEGDPGNRTILASTHLISEFEGLIDSFTIMDAGKDVLHLDADSARSKHRKICARFPGPPPVMDLPNALSARIRGRELEVIVNGHSDEVLERIRQHQPEDIVQESLRLEEIFSVVVK